MGWISKWSASKGMVSVPNILEISKEAAEALIQSNGLTIGTRSTVTQEDNTKTNIVSSQATASGVLADYETPIDFTYRIFSFTPFGVFSFAPVTPFSVFSFVPFTVFSFVPFSVFSFTPAPATLSVTNLSGTATGTTTATISWSSNAQQSFLLMVVPRFSDDEPGFTLRGTTSTSVTATGLTPDNDHDITLFVYSGPNETGSSALAQGLVKTNAATPVVLDKTVPDVVGLTSAAANTAIATAGLVVDGVQTGTTTSLSANSGKVQSQSPAAGTAVASQTGVLLTMWNYVAAGCTVATTYTYNYGEWGVCGATITAKQRREATSREYSTTNADCSITTGTQYYYNLGLSTPWSELRDCIASCTPGTTYEYQWSSWGTCSGGTQSRTATHRLNVYTYADCSVDDGLEAFWQAGRSGPWTESQNCSVEPVCPPGYHYSERYEDCVPDTPPAFSFTPTPAFSFTPTPAFSFTPTPAFSFTPVTPKIVLRTEMTACIADSYCPEGGERFETVYYTDGTNDGGNYRCCSYTPPAFSFTPVAAFSFTPVAPAHPALLSGYHLCAQGDVPNGDSPCYQSDVGITCVNNGASGASCTPPAAFSFAPAPAFSFTPTPAFSFTPTPAFSFTPTPAFSFTPTPASCTPNCVFDDYVCNGWAATYYYVDLNNCGPCATYTDDYGCA